MRAGCARAKIDDRPVFFTAHPGKRNEPRAARLRFSVDDTRALITSILYCARCARA